MTDTFERDISGRTVEFRPPSDAQMLVLARLLRNAERLGEGELDEGQARVTITSMSKVLDIIDSMVINEADRDWLEQQILAREMDLADLMDTLQPENSDTNRAAKRATKRVVKRTAKKAPGRATRD